KAALLVIAADHGIARSASSQTSETSTAEILSEFLCHSKMHAVLRTQNTQLSVIDVGIYHPETVDSNTLLSFRIGHGSADFTTARAMSLTDAEAALNTGFALLYSQAEAGAEMLALAQLGAGSEFCAEAIVAILTGVPPLGLPSRHQVILNSALDRHQSAATSAIELLSRVGGYDIGVLTGLILAATSLQLPILLDGHATSAAALLAHEFHPEVRSYLFASHSSGRSCHCRALSTLGLSPLVDSPQDISAGHQPARAIPLLQAAARVLRESSVPASP
ncbi:MAG: nicotinate-nucleotide--dimethylbenzimidazole phosphoribosyltransferase, partial [Kofleriaceae bacterium]|nr:nicotinate-nucleotide--dimethylbenzimidazole phosphoribosyltransferase [Kofleriaceae bacterium]